MRKGIIIVLLVMLISVTVVGSVSAGKCFRCRFKVARLINNAVKMQRAISLHHPLDPIMHNKTIIAGRSLITVIVDPLEVFAD